MNNPFNEILLGEEFNMEEFFGRMAFVERCGELLGKKCELLLGEDICPTLEPDQEYALIMPGNGHTFHLCTEGLNAIEIAGHIFTKFAHI